MPPWMSLATGSRTGAVSALASAKARVSSVIARRQSTRSALGDRASRGRGGSGDGVGLGSLLGLWAFAGSGGRVYAARTAGHVGGKAFKGKTPKQLSARAQRKIGAREPAGQLGDEGARALPRTAFKKNKGSSELTLASILPLLLFAGVVGYGLYSANSDKALINVGGGGEKGYSVAQIQLGLLGSARLVQRDLDKIAASADTTSRNGLYTLMQDSVIALIRSPEYWVYGNTQGKRTNSQDRTETYFNQFEMAERTKFEVETQSNVQGKKGSREWRRPEKDWKNGGSYTEINELIVVTLIVACEQDLKLPKIESQEDMKVALNRLGSLRASSILAVELFWTPQDPDDVYTQEELITEYPNMVLI